MAQHIDGQKTVVLFSQILLQARDLAGRSGKQHPLPVHQPPFRLPVGILQTALYILASPKSVQILLGFHADMMNREGIIEGRAEYDAAPFEHIRRSQREDPTR